VLYSGTMGYVVDVDTVLDAARIVRDQHDIAFLFVGDGQRLEEYRQRAQDDDSNCVFTGRVSKSSIAGICRRADVCVYPLVDGRIIATLLGNKIFDYMGAGKATIYTGPTGDVSRLIAEAKGGICLPPAAARLLAESILDLRGDPVACERMGDAARDYVMRGLTARDTTRQLAALIASAIR
ncbi:MAG: glycosyltransferase, partial [Rhodothermales bacterium]|nr:glycosyltransferase [Rhodothermales bacterium]